MNFEVNKFLGVILESIINYSNFCSISNKPELAYSYLKAGNELCNILENSSVSSVLRKCIKARLIFSKFLIELEKYDHAEEILEIALVNCQALLNVRISIGGEEAIKRKDMRKLFNTVTQNLKD